MFEPKKDINLLRPDFRDKVRQWLVLCIQNGITIWITETRRTRQRQLWLWGKGRLVSKALEKQYLGYDDKTEYSQPQAKTVTWTLKSKHIDGIAIDYGFNKKGMFTYDGPWERVWALAEKCGLKKIYPNVPDKSHLELA